MGANSRLRRGVKRVANRALKARGYSWLQASAMAWDIRSGAWTEPELALVPLAVRRGETVLDIGANYGCWSYHLDRAVGPSGRVYAFEPVPFTNAALRRVARLLRFRSVHIRSEGCAEFPGELAFTVPIQDNGAISAGQAHLATRSDKRDGHEAHVRWDRDEEVSCPVVRLDDLEIDGEVTLIKCDIEGGELLAFRGCTELIGRWRPTVVAEINPWFLEGFGQTVQDLAAFFEERGYAMYILKDGKLSTVRPENVIEANYVFVHPQNADRMDSILA